MKILILSSDSEAPSHTSLSQELSTLGCEVALVDPKKTEWSLPKGQFKHSGKRIVKPDLVIPRFGYWNFEIGLRLLAGLQAVGCQSVNDWQSIFKANRKDFAAGIFTSLKVPIPQTCQFFLELDMGSFTKEIEEIQYEEDK